MRPPEIRVHLDGLVVDNFAGGGGASTGIARAIGRSPDLAVNHNAHALAVHEANHPTTRHLQEDVFAVEPRMVCGHRPVALAWFSPDCTFHSKARGSRPHRDRNKARRIRGLAGVAVKWAEQVRPRLIIVENVEEFQDWGPLRRTEDGEWEPDPARAGESFRRWVARFRNLGYSVDWRELRACDYGAPTSRKRLFVIASLNGAPVWPDATHGPGRVPFRTAAECIDWSLPCPSIFGRKKPLAENTMRRIARGIDRYVINAARPFIVPVTHTGVRRERPGVDARIHDIDGPVPTITGASRGELALCAPTLIQTRNGEREGQLPRVLDIRAPFNTITARGSQGALVAAFLAKHYGGPNGSQATGQQVEMPIGTVTGVDHHALVEVAVGHAAPDRSAEVRAFLVAYYGVDQDPRLQLPLPTVTTKHRFGLVTVHGVEYVITDIGMRMLQPHELARCTGFGEGYILDPIVDGKRLTKTMQVKLVGNAVPPDFAEAIVRANAGARAMERSA